MLSPRPLHSPNPVVRTTSGEWKRQSVTKEGPDRRNERERGVGSQ
jgi:hypothetical protein